MFTLRVSPSLTSAAVLMLGLAVAGGAVAERADRSRPMTLESDKPCTVNLLKQTSVCSGNVVITQGTLLLRADKLELRETPEGYQVAVATGSDAKPAQFRQKRDGVDEFVEGSAQRIDYDSRSATLRFTGRAQVRRLRGSAVADDITGSLIVWDSIAEQFNVQGSEASGGKPPGRVRAVIAPRTPPEPEAGAGAASGGPGLKPSATLGERP